MTTATRNYFHTASLRQRYIADLDDALGDDRLRGEEHSWLLKLTRPWLADDPDPLRVDRLMLDDGAANPFELAAALMLSHGSSDDPRVYLYSLANGIEAFGDRHGLLAALRVRFAAGDGNALFEDEKIEGDPFRAQMLSIVDHQVDLIGQLSAQLVQIPALPHICTVSLTRQLRTTLPHMALDPQIHLLQIVSASSDGTQQVRGTQALARAAFDQYCSAGLGQGLERRFLDGQGRLANSADAALFAKALSDAADAVAGQYGQLLKAFWSGVWSAQRSRRDLAIESLSNSVLHAFYACRHEGALTVAACDTLQRHWRSGSAAASGCSRLILKVGDRAGCALAATFVVQAGDGDPSLLWLAPDHRWMSFNDLAALAGYFVTAQGRERLRPALALQDQSMLLEEGVLRIELQAIGAPLFADRVDSIIALQACNLAYALGLPRSPETLMAMIDDALDIRQLLDPRQLRLTSGRWRGDAPFSFPDIWLKSQPQPSTDLPGPASANQSGAGNRSQTSAGIAASNAPKASWMEQTQAFDARAQRLRQSASGLLECAEQALQPWLCVLFERPISVREIRVRWLESAPVDQSDVETRAVAVSESQQSASRDLLSWLLECVSAHRSRVLPSRAQVVADAMTSAGPLQTDLVQHMLNRVTAHFIERYLLQSEQSPLEYRRLADRHLQPCREALNLREDAMRLDLALRKRERWLDDAVVVMVTQVLDRPVRALRLALGVAVTEAYSISLTYGEHAVALLRNTLVLTQPQEQNSPGMVWSSEFGWRKFTSSERLQQVLQLKLAGPRRERWLSLLGERDRDLLRTHLLKVSAGPVQIRLDRIDGHVLETLQQAVQEGKQQDLRQLCLRAVRCRFEAELFSRLATATELDEQLVKMLDGLAVRIENSLFEALLPPWMVSASLTDLLLYYDALKRYYQASASSKGFMFGIPLLEDYARKRLLDQMKLDFPDTPLDPDQISVISRRYVSAFPALGQLPSAVPAATSMHTQSLTDYAINRFGNQPTAALSVEQPQAAGELTPDYLRQLVRRLDVGAGYMATLRKAFAPDDTHYAERKQLFVEQLPSVLLALAFPEKLKGALSAAGYEYLSFVLDMPDGIAREPLDGVRVILSPLQLVADPDMPADTAAGVYLIGPADPEAGPVILYAIFHSPFTFRQYANRAALMEAIRTDEMLGQLLLDRLEPEVHRRYANGGFVEPHLASSVGLFDFDVPLRKPGPVTLGIAEVKGNALQFLFAGTTKVLLDIGVSNVVTNEQADRADGAFLAILGLEQALAMVPGKLGAWVMLWQSHTLFRASALSASGHRWGQALSEFTAALGSMVTARRQAIEEPAGDERGSFEPENRPVHEDSPPLAFTWRSSGLTAELRMQLRNLEAKDVALDGMRHDDLLSLYVNNNDVPYAVVDGKVYRVRGVPDEGRVIIVGAHDTPGPRLKLDSNQRWQLDLNLGLKGGGGLLTKLNTASAKRSAEDVLIIEASGMTQIRLLYRDRARRIGQAHSQARRYLQNCLDNLHLRVRGAALDPRVSRIIGDFFGTATPEQLLLAEVESAIKSMFDAVLDLSPFLSPRFVVGTSLPGRETVVAFVIKSDPKRRVFLTDRFFNVPAFALRPEAAAQGFEAAVHYQAANLMHELSHQVLDTYDIAYLEAMAPYPDLLEENTTSNVGLRDYVARLQERRLSHGSDRNRLFKVVENGKWRDIEAGEDHGFDAILRLTKTTNLDDARDVFLANVHKRSRVMLKNADSLTLLILRLGRHNLRLPNP